MADYYVDGDNGNDTTGDGTSGNPWRTTDKVFSEDVLADGDTVWLQGTVRASTAFTSKSNVTFRQWPGETQWRQRGSFVITGWTDDTLGAWFATLAGSNSVKSVIIDPDTATPDANGNLAVHLIAASSLANCRATDNSWFHDTGSNRLYVRIDVSEDPSGFVVEWCEGGVSGLAFNSSNGVTVDGGYFEYFCDSSAGNGYGVFFNGSNNVCRNCTFLDCGYHSLGVAGTGANGGNLFENIVCRGLYPNAGAGVNHLVFYSTEDGAINNRGRNCTMYCHPALSRATGSPLSASASVGGVYSHTDGSPTVMNDVVWEDCNCIFDYNTTGSPWDAANTTAPTDPDNWRQYGVRLVRCTAYGVRQWASLHHMGHYRCTMHMPNIASSTGAAGWLGTGDDSTKYWQFTACEFIVDFDHSSLCALFRNRGTSGSRVSLINCSVIDVGTGSNQRAFFYPWNASVIHYVTGCIIQYNATGAALRQLFVGDTWDQTGTPRRFADNVYVNIGATVYSNNASYNTPAEWTSAIDTGTIDTTTSQFSNLTSNDAEVGDARLTDAAKARTKYLTARTDYGYNNLPYSGNYGAWQYGSEGGMMGRGRSWRGRARIERTQDTPG